MLGFLANIKSFIITIGFSFMLVPPTLVYRLLNELLQIITNAHGQTLGRPEGNCGIRFEPFARFELLELLKVA
jgi:hypothetical protein